MDHTWLVVNSALMALATFALALVLTGLPRRDRRAERLSFDEERRAKLTQGDLVYRIGGGLVDDLTALMPHFYPPEGLERLERALATSGQPLPWTASEFLAVKCVEGLAAGALVGAILMLAVPVSAGLVFALVVAMVYVYTSAESVVSRADARVRKLKSRFSHAVDLMAMILQAGGSTRDALESAARENRGHPLGEELAAVLRRVELGQTLPEALIAFRDRCRDPDVNDFVFSVVQGVELGSPLRQILASQAEQVRLKHSQWCEKRAAEAGVKTSFPNMLVMIGCIIVILGPLLLPVIFETGSSSF